MSMIKQCLTMALVSLLGFSSNGIAQSQLPAQDLQQLFLATLEASPVLDIARYKLYAGKAQQDQANGQLLPQISLSGNFSDNEQDFIDTSAPVTEFDGEKYSAQLRQVLFNWQVFARRKKASLIVDQRQGEYFEQLNLVLIDITERYFMVLGAQDNVDLVSAERSAAEQQLKQAEVRYQRKLVAVTELYEIRARVALIKADEIQARNEFAIAKEALWETSGRTVDGLYRLADDTTFPSIEGTIESWVARALVSNTQLKVRHSAVKVAQQVISERKGEHYPTVSFVASHQKSDLGFENTPAQRREITYFGVDVTIPLYSGGSTSAKVREAYHNRGIAASELEMNRRYIVKRTRAAYLNAASSLQRIEAGRSAVIAADESALAMKKGFDYGTVTFVEVLDALRQQSSAKRDLQQAKYQYINYSLALKKEAGNVDGNDIERINALLEAPSTLLSGAN